MEPISIFDVVQQAKSGSRRAFDLLVERYSLPLKVRVRSRMGPVVRRVCEEDDICQRVFLESFKSIGRFEWRGESSFFAWLKTIAEHVILNECRKRNIDFVTPPVDRTDSTDGAEVMKAMNAPDERIVTPSKLLRREERLCRLKEAWKRLTPEHRRVLHLARIKGYAIKEIALRFGRTPDAISMLLLRAARNLQGFFGSQGSSLRLPVEGSLSSSTNGEGPSASYARLQPKPPQGPGRFAREIPTRAEDGRRTGGGSTAFMSLPATA